jgi:hypothetical protein
MQPIAVLGPMITHPHAWGPTQKSQMSPEHDRDQMLENHAIRNNVTPDVSVSIPLAEKTLLIFVIV